MAERRRRVEDMTTAAELPIKYQNTFNKKCIGCETASKPSSSFSAPCPQSPTADGGIFGNYYGTYVSHMPRFLSQKPIATGTEGFQVIFANNHNPQQGRKG